MTDLVLSLFPGIGLLDMAFEEEGFCVVRGPDLLWGGDIRRFHPPAGRFEGVIGGPHGAPTPLDNLFARIAQRAQRTSGGGTRYGATGIGNRADRNFRYSRGYHAFFSPASPKS